MNAQDKNNSTTALNAHQQSMAAIAALTATGNIPQYVEGKDTTPIATTADKYETGKQPVLSVTQPDMMIRMSEIEIVPEYLEEYKAILEKESSESVKIEPGVIAIYPMYQKGSQNQVRILEIYANQTAYKSHLQTPHFQHYKTTTLKMVKSLKLVDMNAIDPQTMNLIFKKLRE
jgi:quinol monooxygenase YgiN